MRRLPLNLLTLFADLEQSVDDHPAASISVRVMAGHKYLYATTAGDRRQMILGKVGDPDAEAAAAAYRAAATRARDRRKTITALKAAGVPTPDAVTGRLIQAFARAGLFERGAVLVGTSAFQNYAPMVGAVLGDAALRTQDADIAIARIAVPQMAGAPSMTEILRTVDPTFAPRLHRDHKHPFQFISANGFIVDVLTSMGRSLGVVLVKGLDCGAQPLKFMDYLIDEPASTVALTGSGVRVKVPPPLRYALHKLIVAQQPGRSAAKKPKDLAQARDLLEALRAQDADAVDDGIEEALARGPVWRRLVRDGLKLVGG